MKIRYRASAWRTDVATWRKQCGVNEDNEDTEYQRAELMWPRGVNEDRYRDE